MGTLIGSTFRNALQSEFNGTDEYMRRDNPSFKSDQAGAFFFDYTPTSVLAANGTRGIIGLGVNSGANNSRWFIGQRWQTGVGPGNSQPRLEVDCRPTHNGAINILLSTTILTAGTRYACVVTSNGSTNRLYINGAADTLLVNAGSNTGQWMGDVSGGDHRMVTGTLWLANAASNYSDMKLDEVLYLPGREATAAEVTEWYNGGTPINPHRLSFASALATWWRMGDSRDSATTVFDELSAGNDLTLVNMDASNYVAT
jgi:hypothetical protein